MDQQYRQGQGQGQGRRRQGFRPSNQIVLESRIRATNGPEMIEFAIPLGLIELRVSCAIPDEGTDGAPVYIHIHPTKASVGPSRRMDSGNGRSRNNGNGNNADEDDLDEPDDVGNSAVDDGTASS